MKKYFIFLLIVFLITLPNAFSLSMGILCSSDNPTKIFIKGSSFESSGDFLINLVNNTDGDIEVVSVSNEGVLVIKEKPFGLIKSGEFEISGSYPSKELIDERISLVYLDQQGNESEVTIRCVGLEHNLAWQQKLQTDILYFILILLLLLSGLIIALYGHTKKKRDIRVGGLLLLVLSLIALIIFILKFLTLL